MASVVGVASRRGVREHNCDGAYVHHTLDGGVVAVVVDGTGNDPELARLAGFLAELAARTAARHGGLAGLVTAGDLIADDEHEAAAVLAIVDSDGPAVVSWIGDCRAYWWDGATLRQMTTDHTMGQQLRASGGVPVEFAKTHDHWLLVGLSGATAATVRLAWIPDHGEDLTGLVLLTSDGVHDAIPHDDLADLIRRHADPQTLADAIAAAVTPNSDGYRDDATVVVIDAAGKGPECCGE